MFLQTALGLAVTSVVNQQLNQRVDDTNSRVGTVENDVKKSKANIVTLTADSCTKKTCADIKTTADAACPATKCTAIETTANDACPKTRCAEICNKVRLCCHKLTLRVCSSIVDTPNIICQK